MFFYPIIINYERNLSHSDILKNNINGINPEQTEKILGKTTSYLKYFLELALPRILNNQTQEAQKMINEATASNNRNQQATLTLLKEQLVKIRNNFKNKKMKSAWSAYTKEIHYGHENYLNKQTIIESILGKLQAKKILDLGSNNGDFSFLAEANGKTVLSIDSDSSCISHLYEKAKTKGSSVVSIVSDLTNPTPSLGWKNIERKSLLDRLKMFSFLAEANGKTVLSIDSDSSCISHIYEKAKTKGSSVVSIVSDLTNPSPSLGWKNIERKSLLDRLKMNYQADLVFALALLHHLLITCRIPLQEVLKLLHSLTSKYLIIEFIGPTDEMFLQILSTRENIYMDLNETHFEELYSKDFTCLDKYKLTQSRTLYLLERKT